MFTIFWNTVEALWADTLVSGQLYIRPPSQNPIWTLAHITWLVRSRTNSDSFVSNSWCDHDWLLKSLHYKQLDSSYFFTSTFIRFSFCDIPPSNQAASGDPPFQGLFERTTEDDVAFAFKSLHIYFSLDINLSVPRNSQFLLRVALGKLFAPRYR